MGIEFATAWVMLVALGIYALLGGADFGAGIWDLFATGHRKQAQREALEHAIGPIWEANHVWLILVVVLLFTCFPAGFAAIMTALHVPVTLALIGIVMRGSSFVFRTYSPPGAVRARRVWGRVFSIASVITPIMLGVTLGAIASGRLRWEEGVYVSGFFTPWIGPFTFSVGLFALAIFAFLAAVYLCAEVEDAALREDFRGRALWAGAAVGVTAALTWGLAWDGAERLARGLAGHAWAWPLQIGTGLAAVSALAALWFRRFVLARTFAVAQVAMIVLGYGLALYPYVVVPDVTLEAASAPEVTHRLVLAALGAGALILLPSLYYLFRVFKGPRAFTVIERIRR